MATPSPAAARAARFSGVKQARAEEVVDVQLLAGDEQDALTAEADGVDTEITRDEQTDEERKALYRAHWQTLTTDEQRMSFLAITTFELADEALEDEKRFDDADDHRRHASIAGLIAQITNEWAPVIIGESVVGREAARA